MKLQITILFILISLVAKGQVTNELSFSAEGALIVRNQLMKDKIIHDPVFSLLIEDSLWKSTSFKFTRLGDDTVCWKNDRGLLISAKISKDFNPGNRIVFRLLNHGTKNCRIENLVPFGEGADRVYITARGTKAWPAYLCRSVLYRPGFAPVGVVLPDNAWHLGYCDIRIDSIYSLTGLCRRGKRENAEVDRWAVTIKPGGWAEYNFYIDLHRGKWQNGLDMMFRERYLYDLPAFDNSLFERKDLQWMRGTYLMLLRFAWDHAYTDPLKDPNSFYEDYHKYDNLVGGWDIFTLWPTWPRLGLDQRNQFDMYRNLPGGLEGVRKQVDFVHKENQHFFVSYNPWDESTRLEDQMNGLKDLLSATDADGVVLDTRGASSKELQQAADQVRPGIIMYSEGMAIPRDMPGIVSGRVHDALFMPPPLNMNKFIKPDFAIFRVSQLADGYIHRESSVSFFNGYGTEMNVMRPGRPQWIEEEFRYLGQTTRILRENSNAFLDMSWTPLLPTLKDSIWVNEWKDGYKKIYTVYSLVVEGFHGMLFERPLENISSSEIHWVSLWNHEELKPDTIFEDGKIRMHIPCRIDAFNRAYIGTRREGSVECLAAFPKWLDVRYNRGLLSYTSTGGDKVRIWAGNPSYEKFCKEFNERENTLALINYFGRDEGKFVVQLFSGKELIDERIINVPQAAARLISKGERTATVSVCPKGMIEIPGGIFRYEVLRDSGSQEAVIPFPDIEPGPVALQAFYMDKYPVTNGDYSEFIRATHYQPRDTTNFLRQWKDGQPIKGTEDEPVVYVNLDDARAYAAWAGKRLPLEVEWQWAAQSDDGRRFPWGNKMDSTRCNYHLNQITSVKQFPGGKSPFGVMDLIGNVWQMTNDVYDNGSYYFNIIRGGSFYYPKGSEWYVTGGPVSVCHPEMLLLVGPGMDRCATVGFRCIKDKR